MSLKFGVTSLIYHKRSLDDAIKEFEGSSSEALRQLSEFSKVLSSPASLRTSETPREVISNAVKGTK